MVVVKFLVFVSEVASIFSKILTWIIGGQKDTFAPPTQLLGGACPGCPLHVSLRLCLQQLLIRSIIVFSFSFNIQSDIPQNVYKYERMIASYYSSRILAARQPHRAPHLVIQAIGPKPIQHLGFRDRSGLNTRLLRPGLVESACRVHMRSESGHWLL